LARGLSPPLRPDGRDHRLAPGAGFAAGVDPAEEVVREFATVGRVVLEQVLLPSQFDYGWNFDSMELQSAMLVALVP